MHAVIPALPSEYLYREGAPDHLLVNGSGQKDILCERLGWPRARVTAVPSLRYHRDRAPEFDGMVLLPYSCHADAVARKFESFLSAAAPASMPRWRIRIHPARSQHPQHRALAQRLEKIASRYADRMTGTPDVVRQTVIFGATAAVVEALERGFEVVHLCADPLFEKYSPEIWKELDVHVIATGVFRYALRKPGTYIRLSDAGDSAHQWLDITPRVH
jgi:hypothetical protein